MNIQAHIIFRKKMILKNLLVFLTEIVTCILPSLHNNTSTNVKSPWGVFSQALTQYLLSTTIIAFKHHSNDV